MFNKYYQDELAFLREMGKEFSQAHPALAHMLAERGSDPDVERMLEGFSFLAARIRQKLDDEFPELTHSLLNLLWPHYLRPIPSMSILQFQSVPNALRDRALVPRGTEVHSVPVEGTRCRFRTCYDVNLYPVVLEAASLEESAGSPLRLRLSFLMTGGVQLRQVEMRALRIFLHGPPEVTSLVYLLLRQSVSEIAFQGYLEGRASQRMNLPLASLQPVGFAADEALLPYPENSFTGFRLLQEYFALPTKFLFFDVHGLDRAAALETGGKFDLLLSFERVAGKIPRLSTDNFRLYCTPVVNVFSHTSDPIRLDHERVEYRIRPASVEANHYEIYSVDRVVGWAPGELRPREYPPFYSFRHQLAQDREAIFYQTRLKPSVTSEGTDTYVSFFSEQEAQALPSAETISVDLSCTNRRLPEQLRINDIAAPSADSPEYATFQNITRVSASAPPPLGSGLQWRLLSHLAVNYLSLTSAAALRSILELYNFQALHDRQAARENELRLNAIQAVRSKPTDWLFQGVPVRGTAIELDLVEESFSGEGDLYLFATILNELFSLYASLNSFTRLTVRGVKRGEVYQWSPRLGQQVLV